jgi:hypothetical protein
MRKTDENESDQSSNYADSETEGTSDRLSKIRSILSLAFSDDDIFGE